MRLVPVFLLLIVLLAGCLPNSADDNKEVFEQYFKELAQLREYIAAKNIEGVDSLNSGLYYRIIKEGNDIDFALPRGIVRIEYTARRLDDFIFIDTYTTIDPEMVIWGSTRLIKALEQGIEQSSKGGIIEVFSPSILAYGTVGLRPHVKPNEPVIFRIEIKNITNVPGAGN